MKEGEGNRKSGTRYNYNALLKKHSEIFALEREGWKKGRYNDLMNKERFFYCFLLSRLYKMYDRFNYLIHTKKTNKALILANNR